MCVCGHDGHFVLSKATDLFTNRASSRYRHSIHTAKLALSRNSKARKKCAGIHHVPFKKGRGSREYYTFASSKGSATFASSCASVVFFFSSCFSFRFSFLSLFFLPNSSFFSLEREKKRNGLKRKRARSLARVSEEKAPKSPRLAKRDAARTSSFSSVRGCSGKGPVSVGFEL